MQRSRAIRVDELVYRQLGQLARRAKVTPNAIIRRLLLLPPPLHLRRGRPRKP